MGSMVSMVSMDSQGAATTVIDAAAAAVTLNIHMGGRACMGMGTRLTVVRRGRHSASTAPVAVVPVAVVPVAVVAARVAAVQMAGVVVVVV